MKILILRCKRQLNHLMKEMRMNIMKTIMKDFYDSNKHSQLQDKNQYYNNQSIC